MKTKGCTCHNGKYPRWLSSGECKITAQYNKALEKINAPKEQKKQERSEPKVKNTPRQKPIAKVSKKQAAAIREYNKLRAEYLRENEQCGAGLNGCAGKATTIHHKMGRIGKLLNDTEHWIALCLPCHSFVEENPAFAKEQEFSKSRLSN